MCEMVQVESRTSHLRIKQVQDAYRRQLLEQADAHQARVDQLRAELRSVQKSANSTAIMRIQDAQESQNSQVDEARVASNAASEAPSDHFRASVSYLLRPPFHFFAV